MRREIHLGAVLWVAATLTGVAALEAAPTIDHVGLECIEPGTYAVVLSGIDPGMDIQTAKVYFRSALYPDFYYVEMTREKDGFVGILPQVSPETPRVIYYVEAVDQSFESARSSEFDPPVEDPCKDRPAAAYLPGTPGIVVGAVSAGAASLPPGFSAAGIVGTITALGISSGVGGGIGAGSAVAVAAAVGGGVAGAVVVSQAEETTTTTTTAPTTAGGAPTTTVPGAPTSTTTSVPGVPTTTTTAGPSTTTTVPSSTTSSVSAPPLNPDCFTVQVLGDCRVRVDATCVNEPVDSYDWVLDTQGTWATVTRNGDVQTQNWNGAQCGDDANLTFRLTVHRGALSATAEKTILVPGDDLKASRLARATLDSQLDLPGSEGRLFLNGAFLRVVEASNRVTTPIDVRRGANEIEAVLVRASGEPGTLSFEVPEGRELRALEGTVVAIGPRGIVFRLAGTPGERVRLSFVVEP